MVSSMDEVEKMFDGFYPGSKTPTRHVSRPVAPPAPDPVDVPWDAKPIKRTVQSQRGPVTVEFYAISALAKALGKRPTTLRAWMDKKWLPEARYRDIPKNHPDGSQIEGVRLWTHGQIEAIVRIAQEEGLLATRHSDVAASQFPQRVRQWFRENKGLR